MSHLATARRVDGQTSAPGDAGACTTRYVPQNLFGGVQGRGRAPGEIKDDRLRGQTLERGGGAAAPIERDGSG